MRFVFFVLLTLLLAPSALAFDAASPLLPPDHWAVKAADRLEELGLVDRFMPAQRAVPLLAVRRALAEGEERARAVRPDLVSLVKAWRERFEASSYGVGRMPPRGRRCVNAASSAPACRAGMVGLLGDLIGAARAAAGRWMPAGECLELAARHFIDTWKEPLKERSTLQRRVLERERGLCQAPGCSRAAAHAHHIVYRSRGGSDRESNLLSLCAGHHLHGVHRGYIRVKGEARARSPGASPDSSGERRGMGAAP